MIGKQISRIAISSSIFNSLTVPENTYAPFPVASKLKPKKKSEKELPYPKLPK